MRYLSLFSKLYGMLLVIGLIGLGKSTTFYVMLTALSNFEVNIIMVEDLVEYWLLWVN